MGLKMLRDHDDFQQEIMKEEISQAFKERYTERLISLPSGLEA